MPTPTGLGRSLVEEKKCRRSKSYIRSKSQMKIDRINVGVGWTPTDPSEMMLRWMKD